MDSALNAMPAWQVIKEQEPALHQRILDQMAALQKAGEPGAADYRHHPAADPASADAASAERPGRQRGELHDHQHGADRRHPEGERRRLLRFLYPTVKGGVNPMRMLDKDLMTRRHAGRRRHDARQAPDSKFDENGLPCISKPYIWPERKMNVYRGWEIYPKGIYDFGMKIKKECPDLPFYF